MQDLISLLVELYSEANWCNSHAYSNCLLSCGKQVAFELICLFWRFILMNGLRNNLSLFNIFNVFIYFLDFTVGLQDILTSQNIADVHITIRISQLFAIIEWFSYQIFFNVKGESQYQILTVQLLQRRKQYYDDIHWNVLKVEKLYITLLVNLFLIL